MIPLIIPAFKLAAWGAGAATAAFGIGAAANAVTFDDIGPDGTPLTLTDKLVGGVKELSNDLKDIADETMDLITAPGKALAKDLGETQAIGELGYWAKLTGMTEIQIQGLIQMVAGSLTSVFGNLTGDLASGMAGKEIASQGFQLYSGDKAVDASNDYNYGKGVHEDPSFVPAAP